MSAIAIRFFLLLVGHALCDYPLQGGFLATAKNHRNPVPGVPWYQCLAAHAMIHAGAVYVVTHSWWAALSEFAFHASIDYWKNDGRFTFNQDQALHIACKLVWAVLA